MYGISMFMDLLDLLEISQRPFTYGNGNRAKNLKDRLEREEESVRRMESLTIDIVGWILVSTLTKSAQPFRQSSSTNRTSSHMPQAQLVSRAANPTISSLSLQPTKISQSKAR